MDASPRPGYVLASWDMCLVNGQVGPTKRTQIRVFHYKLHARVFDSKQKGRGFDQTLTLCLNPAPQ